MKVPKTVRLKTFLVSLTLVSVIFLASIAYVVSNGGFTAPNIYLDDLPSTASYTVKTDGTYFWAVRYDGKIDTSSTNSSLVQQYALAHFTNGTLYLKNVQFDSTLTVLSTQTVIEEYNGQTRTFTGTTIPEIIAGVSTANYAGVEGLKEVHPSSTSSISAIGQSFTTGTVAREIIAAKFYLDVYGFPTGSLIANLYTHSGTYGTSSVPTGSALATSDSLNLMYLYANMTSCRWVTFTFSGANQYLMAANTHYVIEVQASSGTFNSTYFVGVGGCNNLTDGNLNTYYSSAWHADSTEDNCFIIYGLKNQTIQTEGNKQTTVLSPTTAMNLTNLNLVSGKEYKLTVCCQSPFITNNGSLISFFWRINGDHTSTNYRSFAVVRRYDSELWYVTVNNNFFDDNNKEGDTVYMVMNLFVTPEGNVIASAFQPGYIRERTEIAMASFIYEPKIPLNQVTQIDVYADMAGGLGLGSFMSLSYSP